MAGYTFGALMLYYLMVPLVERVVNGQEMGFMSGEIYDGGLTRYLLYPVSYLPREVHDQAGPDHPVPDPDGPGPRPLPGRVPLALPGRRGFGGP